MHEESAIISSNTNYMVDICHGLPRRRIPLQATRKYMPEEIMAMCRGASPPYYILVQNTMIPIKENSCLALACEISSAYHNWVAYNAPDNDGSMTDTEDAEGL
jgi:hypothetical protein